MITFNSFDSREELDLRLSNRLETDLNKAIYENVKLAADYKHFPVAAVLNQRSVSVDVYWSP